VVPAFTFIASATVAARLGARPVFADIDPETYQMDPARLEAAMTPRTRAIIAVHLYGHPAPLEAYLRLAGAGTRPIPLIEDAAQAIGTRLPGAGGRRPAAAGTIGLWGCFSFYPTKNLPACGEAGLMVTADASRAGRARQLRTHGQTALYEHSLLGGNARLDALQAAILRARLPRLEQWNERRRAGAALYDRLFTESGILGRREEIRLPPRAAAGGVANYHQYTLRVPEREALRAYLLERGIHTGIYYPTPVPFQPVFAYLKHRPGDFPQAERAAREVLSLPIHQHLSAGAIERVAGAVVDFYKR
jgi:dTDP-4-amino-4,6-dideoxygalactose transaminase